MPLTNNFFLRAKGFACFIPSWALTPYPMQTERILTTEMLRPEAI